MKRSFQNADMNFNSIWKSIYKDGLPKKDCRCVILNENDSYETYMAVYRHWNKTFIEFQPERYNRPTLAVTHYIEIPTFKLKEEYMDKKIKALEKKEKSLVKDTKSLLKADQKNDKIFEKAKKKTMGGPGKKKC